MRLLDTPPEEPFDRLTRLAARTLGAPIALVSLVDDHRQFFKSTYGLPEPWSSQRETPLSQSFCQHVVASGSPLLVTDARRDPRVRDNPAIATLNVIAYLGVPLTTTNGRTLGSFCVISPWPTNWSAVDLETMSELAASVMSEIALRCAHDDLLAANTRLLLEAAARDAALQELRQSEARLRTAQRLAHVGNLELRAQPTPDSYWSEEARRIMGLGTREPPSSIDDFVATLVHPDDAARVAAAIEQALTGQETTEIEYRTCLPDGSTRTLLTAIEPGQRLDGIKAAVCTALDVTERYRTEAALAEQRNELFHVARLATAGEMATVMAHEINQPLAAISHTANACGRLLRAKRLDSDDLAEHLDGISAQAKRASEIIRRIGNFVRKRPSAHERVDLDRIVTDILVLLTPSSRWHAIQLGRIAGDGPTHVDGDEIQLGQLVANLVRNAFDAVARNPASDRRVQITTSNPDPDHVMLTVADNGPGIPEHIRDRLFEPFFTTRRNGLGMGLAIARTIAEAHNATLSLDAPQGTFAGAVFKIVFPVTR